MLNLIEDSVEKKRCVMPIASIVRAAVDHENCWIEHVFDVFVLPFVPLYYLCGHIIFVLSTKYIH